MNKKNKRNNSSTIQIFNIFAYYLLYVNFCYKYFLLKNYIAIFSWKLIYLYTTRKHVRYYLHDLKIIKENGAIYVKYCDTYDN
jgi:hypothetical protein